MSGLLQTQTCPYCDYEVEDCYSNWEEDQETVICDDCKKEYEVRAVYRFEGFYVEKKCQECGESSEDGVFYCDCNEVDKE